MSCIDTNNEQFIPSFTTLVLPAESPSNPSEFSEQVEQAVPEIDQPELYNASVSFCESSNIVEQIDLILLVITLWQLTDLHIGKHKNKSNVRQKG